MSSVHQDSGPSSRKPDSRLIPPSPRQALPNPGPKLQQTRKLQHYTSSVMLAMPSNFKKNSMLSSSNRAFHEREINAVDLDGRSCRRRQDTLPTHPDRQTHEETRRHARGRTTGHGQAEIEGNTDQNTAGSDSQGRKEFADRTKRGKLCAGPQACQPKSKLDTVSPGTEKCLWRSLTQRVPSCVGTARRKIAPEDPRRCSGKKIQHCSARGRHLRRVENEVVSKWMIVQLTKHGPQEAQRTSGEVSMLFWTVVNFSSADEIMKIAKKNMSRLS